MLAVYRFLGMLLDLILLVITFFLGLRIILHLFSANPGTPFVAWIYNISNVLMSPFRGIIANVVLPGAGVIDVPAIVALVVYVFVIQLISSILRSLDSGTGSAYHHYHRNV